MLMIRNERPTWSRARGFKGWTDLCVLIATLGLTELSLPGRNGQVHEAWEGGDGPSWTLRRAQSCHRQGETRKSFWKPSVTMMTNEAAEATAHVPERPHAWSCSFDNQASRVYLLTFQEGPK